MNAAEYKQLKSIAWAAKELCEWARENDFPSPMSDEFMHLTQLIDRLDTAVRRVPALNKKAHRAAAKGTT